MKKYNNLAVILAVSAVATFGLTVCTKASAAAGGSQVSGSQSQIDAAVPMVTAPEERIVGLDDGVTSPEGIIVGVDDGVKAKKSTH